MAFQVMMSGPSDLFTGSGCEASRKKKNQGKPTRKVREMCIPAWKAMMWWQNVSAQLLSGLLPVEFEWIRISFTVIS